MLNAEFILGGLKITFKVECLIMIMTMIMTQMKDLCRHQSKVKMLMKS